MKTENRIDGIFREGLPEAGLPPPPTQDWAAMARAARTNAVLAGKGRSGSAASRWAKILGGALVLAVGTVIFLVQSDHVQEPSTAVTAAAIPVAPNTALITGATKEPYETTPASGSTDRSLTSRPVEAQEQQPPNTKVSPSTSNVMAARSEGPIDRTGQRISAVGEKEGGIHDRMFPVTDPINAAGTRVADGPRSPALGVDRLAPPDGSAPALSANTTSDIRARLARMGLLAPVASSLPYQPEAATAVNVDPHIPFHHWSVAPWISVGMALVTDPDKGSGVPEGLNHSGMPARTGVRVQYALDRTLAFFTGIGVSQKGTLRGWINSSSEVRTEYHLSGKYIEVPMAFKIIHPLGGLETYARAGLTLQFNRRDVGNMVVMHDEQLKERSTLALAGGSMGTAVDLGIGVNLRVGDRFGLFVEPCYEHTLSPVVKHPSFSRLPFNPRIHTFSLVAGLSYQFR